MSEYVTVRDLPAIIREALESVRYGKKDIPVSVAERTTIGRSAMGDGYQGFTVLIDLDANRFHTERGSWGGSNPFVSRPVDDDTQQYAIPPHGAVITGQRGGGRPVSATLHIPASMRAHVLPAAPTGDQELSLAEQYVLYALRGFKSSYRPDYYRRKGLSAARVREATDSLVARGLASRNRAGATAITTAGRNVPLTVNDSY